uniref:C-factor-like n=1 Tax=Salvator merianae TaxID=96440 RepID=A0A8D0DUL9_SALMN
MAVLKARSVLVTGSNRGIGLELVKQLVARSDRPEWIFAGCRDPEGPRAQELKQLTTNHKGVVIIPLDTSNTSSIKNAATRVTELLKGAGLNLLINNAGIVRPTVNLDSETAEDMAEVYRTNVIGPMEVSQAFLPFLKKASRESSEKGMSCSRAAIINVSSEAGSIKNIFAWSDGHIVSYRCSKAALNMLTRCQSLAYAEDKILCIALHPGWVQTDMGNLAIHLYLATTIIDHSSLVPS